jgi:hypothetical protein
VTDGFDQTKSMIVCSSWLRVRVFNIVTLQNVTHARRQCKPNSGPRKILQCHHFRAKEKCHLARGPRFVYVVLGIPSDADDRSIRGAFRSLVRRYHPDAGEGSSPEEFRRLVEAYETLADPVRRQAYDESLRSVPPRRPIFVEPMVGPAGSMRRFPMDASIRPGIAWSLEELFEQLWREMEVVSFRRPFSARW